MTQNALPENEENDLESPDTVYEVYLDRWKELDNELAEWMDRHPVFTKKLGFVNDGEDIDPSVANYEMDHVEDGKGICIESEWEFLVTYGYREAVADVVCALENQKLREDS